jgi:TRAP-type C4-dicarboxylate transport system permease large subunit
MVLGSLAAGGALGNLIPPGIIFIIYALMIETSVGARPPAMRAAS